MPTQKQTWAAAAGRLMIEEGFVDYRLAKQKAAKQFTDLTSEPPNNLDVELAAQSVYAEHLDAEVAEWHLDQLQFALETIEHFAQFAPRLTGILTWERPHALDEIELHIPNQQPELVLDTLYNMSLFISIREKTYRTTQNKLLYLPVFAVPASNFTALLVVLNEQNSAQTLLSPTDGKPIRYWDADQIKTSTSKVSLCYKKI